LRLRRFYDKMARADKNLLYLVTNLEIVDIFLYNSIVIEMIL